MKHFLTLLMLLCLFRLDADIDDIGEADPLLEELQKENLFVSLGSTCDPAKMLRFCGFRKVAYPFDWLVSMDGDKVREMIEDDFAYFLEPSCLVSYASGSALLHTFYHLEFLHDGKWSAAEYSTSWATLYAKYQRRIERFRSLENFSGRVFFIRTAYPHSHNDPHRYYLVEENLEITEKAAQELYGSLKKRFPRLKFTLVILNCHYENRFVLEKKMGENVVLYRGPTIRTDAIDIGALTTSYKKFFLQLLN